MSDAQFPPPPPTAPQNNQPMGQQDSPYKPITHIIYALYAASLFVGITVFIAIILNYIKNSDVKNSWIESHFRWQIRTFWYGLLWGIIGGITAYLLFGYLILLLNVLWFIYRIAKGWLRLMENQPMYT